MNLIEIFIPSLAFKYLCINPSPAGSIFMKILLNNREEEFTRETISVSEMLLLKKFSFKMRIIKINNVLISKENYDSTIINSGDDVQMLYLMSGG